MLKLPLTNARVRFWRLLRNATSSARVHTTRGYARAMNSLTALYRYSDRALHTRREEARRIEAREAVAGVLWIRDEPSPRGELAEQQQLAA